MTELEQKLLRALTAVCDYLDRPDACGDDKEVASTARKLIADSTRHPPAADADGWFPWPGGDCSVGASIRVDAKLRCGKVVSAPAGEFRWGHSDAYQSGDIIAYRIAKEPG